MRKAPPSASNSFKAAELCLIKEGLALRKKTARGFSADERDALERVLAMVLCGGDVKDLLRSQRVRDALRKIPSLPLVAPADEEILLGLDIKLDKMLARVQSLAESASTQLQTIGEETCPD